MLRDCYERRMLGRLRVSVGRTATLQVVQKNSG